jgi:hypothetical protein
MNLRENLSRSKEVLAGYFRQGLHELGAVFYGAGTAAQHPEYGMIGTRTPGEVTAGMRGTPDRSNGRDEPAPSTLDSYLREAKERGEQTREPEREAREIERE